MLRRSYYIWHKNNFDEKTIYYPFPFTFIDIATKTVRNLLKYNWTEKAGITEVVE